MDERICAGENQLSLQFITSTTCTAVNWRMDLLNMSPVFWRYIDSKCVNYMVHGSLCLNSDPHLSQSFYGAHKVHKDYCIWGLIIKMKLISNLWVLKRKKDQMDRCCFVVLSVIFFYVEVESHVRHSALQWRIPLSSNLLQGRFYPAVILLKDLVSRQQISLMWSEWCWQTVISVCSTSDVFNKQQLNQLVILKY